MGRSSRTKSVRESAETLYRLLKRYEGTGQEARLRMLLLFSEDPALSFFNAAEAIETSEKTVRRWWTLYAEGGVEGLLELRTYSTGDNGQGALPSDDTSFDNGAFSARMVKFLNAIPFTPDTRLFGERFREALIEMFDDVSYAVINVRVTVNLLNPERNQLGETYRDNFDANSGKAAAANIAFDTQRPVWKHIYLTNKGNIPQLEQYREPIGFDYFYDSDTAFVGCIMLFSRTTEPPISSSTVALMEELYPFIVRTFASHIGFRQHVHPSDLLSRDLFNILDPTQCLSPREREVMKLAVFGHTNTEIAEMLSIKLTTAETHIHNAFMKLNLGSFREITARFLSTRVTFPGRAAASTQPYR